MQVVAKKVNRINCDYITEGKRYNVNTISDSKRFFAITDDIGDNVDCFFKGCFHIQSSWVIIGNPAVAVPNG